MRTSQNTNHKKPKTFTKYMQEKLAITVLVITLALFALVVVLYRIVRDKSSDYTQIVLSQQEYGSRVIPFRRGDILDRNKLLLASTEKVYNLILDPKQLMKSPEGSLELTIETLADYFGYDREELSRLFQERQDDSYVRYARQLDYDQRQGFLDKQKQINDANREKDVKARVGGVWFEDEYKRIYPENELACNVIGFAQSDGSGGTGGIEQFYNDRLIGVNGREYGYLNDESNLERVIKPATNGHTVVSTIDQKVQSVVEKYIDQWQTETGSETTAVVVMDPRNGEVLAMAGDRRYDLNDPKNLEGRYTDEELMALGREEAAAAYKRENPGEAPITPEQASEHYDQEEILGFGRQVAWNQVWRNFCVSDAFEPGSPSKIFTVSAALEEGAINGTESYLCDGFQEIGGWKIRCVKKIGHGMLTVQESLMQSCNDVMMQIAAQTGADRFYQYHQLFGFGSKTGLDLPGEAAGLVRSAGEAVPTDMATNAFGQNFTCTMIQMAAAYCSVINGGSYYEPHVVKQILNEQGAVVENKDPVLVRETVSQTTSEFIREALFRTVSEGTGSAAAIPGYEICGKTGTAERIPRDHTNYVVSFVGFAPKDDPQVLVYVVIDRPHVESQPHSTYASKLCKNIMTEILPQLNIFSDLELTATPGEAGQPEEEGITGGTAGSPQEGQPEEEAPPETKVYESDEYVEPEGEGETFQELPADLPETSAEGPEGDAPPDPAE